LNPYLTENPAHKLSGPAKNIPEYRFNPGLFP